MNKHNTLPERGVSGQDRARTGRHLLTQAARRALVALALAAGAGWAGGAGLARADDIPQEFIVRLRPGFTIEEVAATYLAEILASGPTGAYLVRTPGGSDDAMTQTELENDPRVLSAEQNKFQRAPEGGSRSFLLRSQPIDYEQQAARAALALPQAQGVALGTYVTVAVLDTGVNPGATLAGVLRFDGYDFVNNSPDASEFEMGVDTNGDGTPDGDYGHGTMVAGLIHMVAPEARILPIKVLDSDGVGSSFALAQAIDWAVKHHADVINLSLATPDNAPIVSDAVQAATDAGVVVVAAVGNAGLPAPFYPAAVRGVIAVAATDATDHRATFSDYGTYVTICAPGVDVVSTDADGFYASGSGTSFSAPLVAGVAALLQSVYVHASPSTIKNAITSKAVNISGLNPGFNGLLGAGRVSAGEALVASAGHAGCRADFNQDGSLNPDDIGDFITAYFDPLTAANPDYNADGDQNPDDLGDYITAYFIGCAHVGGGA